MASYTANMNRTKANARLNIEGTEGIIMNRTPKEK
jgi:hypothetical protein